MGMATIQIWITSEGSPCTISERDEHDNTPWYVAIMHCDGRVLKWCKTDYSAMVAECGHLEVKVPPGCYIIRAGEGLRVDPKTGGLLGNHLSDHAVVTACCDETVCVTLFAPTLHNCLFGVHAALQEAAKTNLVPRNLAEPAIAALAALRKEVKGSPFDERGIAAMSDLLQKAIVPRKA
jgi:hypothetical protein